MGIWEGSDDIRHVMPVRAYQVTFLSLMLDLYCNTAHIAVKVVTIKKKFETKCTSRIRQLVENFFPPKGIYAVESCLPICGR